MQAAVVANGFRLLQRTAVSSAVASVNIQAIPADINDLMIHFDLTPVSNGTDLVCQFYDNTGTIDATNLHYGGSVRQSSHLQNNTAVVGLGSSITTFSSGIAINSISASLHVGTAQGIAGRASLMNIRAASRVKVMTHECTYLDSTNTLIAGVSGMGYRSVAGAITGLRMLFVTGNIASGAFSVWGSP